MWDDVAIVAFAVAELGRQLTVLPPLLCCSVAKVKSKRRASLLSLDVSPPEFAWLKCWVEPPEGLNPWRFALRFLGLGAIYTEC